MLRDLFFTRLGGLGIGDPRLSQFDSSLKITYAVVVHMVQQDSLFNMATVEAQHLVSTC